MSAGIPGGVFQAYVQVATPNSINSYLTIRTEPPGHVAVRLEYVRTAANSKANMSRSSPAILKAILATRFQLRGILLIIDTGRLLKSEKSRFHSSSGQ
jgi:hypothetical protein